MSAVLRFASDVAVELRDLHEGSRVYGKLSVHSVSIGQAGARLTPLRSYWDQAVPDRDIQAFGAVLYQMLHGNPPPSTLNAADLRIHSPENGPARLRAAGTKLALRCLSPKGPRITMQQVATELRLLTVMQRQEDANARSPSEYSPPPAPSPDRNQAPPTWTPPIEMLIDVPGAVPLPPAAAFDEIGHATPAVPDSEIAAPVVQLGPASFGEPEPKPPAQEVPSAGRCPKCDAAVVYMSRARSGIELFFERMKFPIVRCHRCYHRYLVIGRIRIPKDMPVGTARKFRPRKRHT